MEKDLLEKDYFKEIIDLTQKAEAAFLEGTIATPQLLSYKIRSLVNMLIYELRGLEMNYPLETIIAAEIAYTERKAQQND